MHRLREIFTYYFKNCSLCGSPYGKYKKEKYGYICDDCIKNIQGALIKHELSYKAPLVLNDDTKSEVYSIFRYEDDAKDALLNLKMKRKTEMALLFSYYLENALKRWNLDKDISVFIPIPASKKGFRERGYDQVMEVLLSGQFKILDCVYLTGKSKEMQKKLSGKDRAIAVKGKFDIDNFMVNEYVNNCFKEGHKFLNVIVIDDVFTTGASMKEVCSLVKASLSVVPNVRVFGVTLFCNVKAL